MFSRYSHIADWRSVRSCEGNEHRAVNSSASCELSFVASTLLLFRLHATSTIYLLFKCIGYVRAVLVNRYYYIWCCCGSDIVRHALQIDLSALFSPDCIIRGLRPQSNCLSVCISTLRLSYNNLYNNITVIAVKQMTERQRERKQ